MVTLCGPTAGSCSLSLTTAEFGDHLLGEQCSCLQVIHGCNEIPESLTHESSVELDGVRGCAGHNAGSRERNHTRGNQAFDLLGHGRARLGNHEWIGEMRPEHGLVGPAECFTVSSERVEPRLHR